MDLGISGRMAIVCGSSRGLGRACAISLARAGCTVIVNGIDAARLQATATEIARMTNAQIVPVLGLDLSSGARAGLTAFLAGVSRSVAHANVTINNILPGFIDTDRFQNGIEANAAALGKSEQQMRAEREQQVPAKRIGRPEEFGEACAFLCSAQAGYITGQNLLLDGGLHNSAF